MWKKDEFYSLKSAGKGDLKKYGWAKTSKAVILLFGLSYNKLLTKSKKSSSTLKIIKNELLKYFTLVFVILEILLITLNIIMGD